MWKPPLKTNWYEMCENWHFENWVKLFITNLWNLVRVFKRWKLKRKNKINQVSKSIIILGPNGYKKKPKNHPTLIFSTMEWLCMNKVHGNHACLSTSWPKFGIWSRWSDYGEGVELKIQTCQKKNSHWLDQWISQNNVNYRYNHFCNNIKCLNPQCWKLRMVCARTWSLSLELWAWNLKFNVVLIDLHGGICPYKWMISYGWIEFMIWIK
jgi:hypothetical protein